MSTKIAVIGLGYVGLPLAVEFGKKYKVVGFDVNQQRLAELRNGEDRTLEIESDHLKSVLSTNNIGLTFSNQPEDIMHFDYYIVTVPTPVDKNNYPDFTPLIKASETVGKVIKKGSTVIYESTVYPGATEEICVPILEQFSDLKFNSDFFIGYSPERINPGDKERTLTKIKKIVSGSTDEVAVSVQNLYNDIIEAGTFKASSIKVAEAAKVIENVQRDINIAVANELARIFNKLKIDTTQVLEAAGTKWNFIHVKPGLVGGHCIGVDPYYLIQKAQEAGYHPEIMLASRRLNESMGDYVAHELIKLMIDREIQVKNSKVLILGVAFKENCPDLRNTKVVNVVKILRDYHINVDIYDPWVSSEQLEKEYGMSCLNEMPTEAKYDGILLAVAHNEFRSIDISKWTKSPSVVYDIKSILPITEVDNRL
ncbi:MAG: nucleotide sugar dehydrogenase [Bacteroidetes bacterium]|jgi:UDP-N-acetyl-D-galactosamine dehydrogenase|nr:nucleotide sugar dehydrogenase [Bacteroidota bacterium]